MEETMEVVVGSAIVEPTTSKDVPTAATEGARLGETQFSVVRHDRPLFWPEGESVEDFIAAATEGRHEEEDEPDS